MQIALAGISKFGRFLKIPAKETIAFVLKVSIGLASTLPTKIMMVPLIDCAQPVIVRKLVLQVLIPNGYLIRIKLGGKFLLLVLDLEEDEEDIWPIS